MKWVLGKVLAQKAWTPTLFSLFIEAPPISFEAGQFTQLALEANPTLFRPYSFVNAPNEPIIEFYYDLITGGKFTSSLFKLQQGNSIWLAGKPAGRFVLSCVPDAPVLWLFATGTGLGVFLSLLKTPDAWARFHDIVLIHSVGRTNALTHQSLIQTWEQQYGSRFHFVPIVTQEPHPQAFGERIPQLLESGKLEALLNLKIAADNAQVMLCGNPGMVSDVARHLNLRGLHFNHREHPGSITVESYWKE